MTVSWYDVKKALNRALGQVTHHVSTHPFPRLTQLHHCPPNLSPTGPTLHLIPSASDATPPPIRIHGELVRYRTDISFLPRQEIVRKPPWIEQGPLDPALLPQNLPKGFAGYGVKVRFQGECLAVADPLRWYQTFASKRQLAGGEKGNMDLYVAGSCEVD